MRINQISFVQVSEDKYYSEINVHVLHMMSLEVSFWLDTKSNNDTRHNTTSFNYAT